MDTYGSGQVPLDAGSAPGRTLPAEFLAAVAAALQKRSLTPRGRFYAEATHSYTGLIENIELQSGLTDAECARVELLVGAQLPTDLRSFLQYRLPVGTSFPDWRAGEDKDLTAWAWEPIRALLNEAERDRIWLDSWGDRPLSPDVARATANTALTQAPKLIPIYSHRYLIAGPNPHGNPILSMVGTDIIYYGVDLADYLSHEFGVTRPAWAASDPQRIEPWDTFVKLNGG